MIRHVEFVFVSRCYMNVAGVSFPITLSTVGMVTRPKDLPGECGVMHVICQVASYYAVVDVGSAFGSGALLGFCPPVLLRLGRLRFGNGVVGSWGGTLTDSLSPSSVSFVTLSPN